MYAGGDKGCRLQSNAAKYNHFNAEITLKASRTPPVNTKYKKVVKINGKLVRKGAGLRAHGGQMERLWGKGRGLELMVVRWKA